MNVKLFPFWFSLVLITLSACESDIKNCSAFKTGTFKYSDSDRFVIYRDTAVQIEIDNVTGMKITSSIVWKSNCQYTLTYEKFDKPIADFSDRIGDKIHVAMTATNLNSYQLSLKSSVSEDVIWLEKIGEDKVPPKKEKTISERDNYVIVSIDTINDWIQRLFIQTTEETLYNKLQLDAIITELLDEYNLTTESSISFFKNIVYAKYLDKVVAESNLNQRDTIEQYWKNVEYMGEYNLLDSVIQFYPAKN